MTLDPADERGDVGYLFDLIGTFYFHFSAAFESNVRVIHRESLIASANRRVQTIQMSEGTAKCQNET